MDVVRGRSLPAADGARKTTGSDQVRTLLPDAALGGTYAEVRMGESAGS
jgi:hypothetical protein